MSLCLHARTSISARRYAVASPTGPSRLYADTIWALRTRRMLTSRALFGCRTNSDREWPSFRRRRGHLAGYYNSRLLINSMRGVHRASLCCVRAMPQKRKKKKRRAQEEEEEDTRGHVL